MKSRINLLMVFSLLLATPTWASVADEKAAPDILDMTIQHLVLLMGSIVVAGTLFGIYKAVKTIWKLQTIRELESSGMSHQAALKEAGKASFLGYVYQQMDGGVSLEEEADIMMHHDYDGIRELDNNLPPWWVGMFYVTIVYAVLYIGIYHFSDIGISSAEQYQQEVKQGQIIRANYAAKIRAKKEAEGKLAKTATNQLMDKKELAIGKQIYTNNCAVCHGKQGEGLTGPNLTDDYWLHGGGMKNIVNTIREGIHGKNMIAWEKQLEPIEIQEVASYILSLGGTTPINAKAPEGEKFEKDDTISMNTLN